MKRKCNFILKQCIALQKPQTIKVIVREFLQVVSPTNKNKKRAF